MKKKRITKMTFSKWLALFILIVAEIDLQICIFKSQENTAEKIITVIIGAFLIYALKAFFGKREEEKTRLKEEQAKYERTFEEL